MRNILFVLLMMSANLAHAVEYTGAMADSYGYSDNGIHVFVKRVYSGSGDVNHIGLIMTKFQNRALTGSFYKLSYVDGKWLWYPYAVQQLSESIYLPTVDDNPTYFQTGSDPSYIRLTATPLYGRQKLNCFQQIYARRDPSAQWLSLAHMPPRFKRGHYEKFYDVSPNSGYDWTVVPNMESAYHNNLRHWDRARFKEPFRIEENVPGLGLLTYNRFSMRGELDVRSQIDAFFALVTSNKFSRSNLKGVLVTAAGRGFSCENPMYTFDGREAGRH